MDKVYSLGEIKGIVAPIANKHGVERICLFGSYARGEADEKSDLDFLIDKGRIRGLGFADLLCDLQDGFSKNIDLLTFASLYEHNKDERFNKKIESDMVVVYEQ